MTRRADALNDRTVVCHQRQCREAADFLTKRTAFFFLPYAPPSIAPGDGE